MKKIPEWFMHQQTFPRNWKKTFAAVEKALGFKLFIWQKTFIANTTYRRTEEPRRKYYGLYSMYQNRP